MESQPQNPEFIWKVSLKILNSGIILKTFTHAFTRLFSSKFRCVISTRTLDSETAWKTADPNQMGSSETS